MFRGLPFSRGICLSPHIAVIPFCFNEKVGVEFNASVNPWPGSMNIVVWESQLCIGTNAAMRTAPKPNNYVGAARYHQLWISTGAHDGSYCVQESRINSHLCLWLFTCRVLVALQASTQLTQSLSTVGGSCLLAVLSFHQSSCLRVLS